MTCVSDDHVTDFFYVLERRDGKRVCGMCGGEGTLVPTTPERLKARKEYYDRIHAIREFEGYYCEKPVYSYELSDLRKKGFNF